MRTVEPLESLEPRQTDWFIILTLIRPCEPCELSQFTKNVFKVSEQKTFVVALNFSITHTKQCPRLIRRKLMELW